MAQKMLRPGTLALRNLKRHKRQYAATVTGIILALVFASGFLYFFYCYRASAEILRNEEYGLEDCIIMHTNEEAIKQLQSQDMIEENGLAHILGYLYAGEDFKTTGATVAWLDDEAKELANPTLLAGAWPEKDEEIAIEQTAMAQMGLKAEVGDTITLTMQPQNGSALSALTVEKSYTLTGILSDKRSNLAAGENSDVKMDIPAAFVCAGTQTEPGGLEGLACYCKLPNSGGREQSLWEWIYGDDGSDTGRGHLLNTVIIAGNMLYTTAGKMMSSRFNQTAILIGVLLVAACAAIVNAFNTNLQARKKQIGMLRAVGATKGQIVKMYGIEALLIACLCVPVSLLLSYFAVRGVIGLLGSDYVFVPNLWVLFLCGVFGLLCVLLAAMIPLVGATRISPIQAIRNISATRKMKTKRVRTKKDFRLPKLLAARRTMFSKRRQVVISLFLTIAIIGSGYAVSYGTYQLDHSYRYNFDYQLNSTSNIFVDILNVRAEMNGFTESDRQAVLRLPYIESSTGQKQCHASVRVDALSDYLNMAAGDMIYDNIDITSGRADELTGENYRSLLWQKESDTYARYKTYIQSDYLPVELGAADSETLEQLAPYLDSGQINTDRIDAGEEVIVIAPVRIGFYAEPSQGGGDHYYLSYDTNADVTSGKHSYFATAERDRDLTAGKALDLAFLFSNHMPDEEEAADTQNDTIETRSVQTAIGAVLAETPKELELLIPSRGHILVLTSISGMEKLAGSLPYSQIDFTLNQPCTGEIDSEVQPVLDEITSRIDDAYSTSAYALVQQQKNDTRTMLTIVLSIVILLFVFCGAIVNNTITADIRENRRELGTLRAVGASAKELSQAYILQLFKMLGWGSAIGLFGFTGSFFAIRLIGQAMDYGTMEFTFSPWVPILFCLVLFAVCSLNLYIKIKHETKNSIVDNIREL